ncbi:MAG: mechanosensitive ion channel [Gammaproteobacteria bacterium]
MEQIDPSTFSYYLDAYLIPWGIKLLTAIIIFLIGRWLAKLVVGLVHRLMQRARVDDTLITFLGGIIYAILLVAVAIAALDRLGVNTTSLLAILGAAGLAVGLAMKDSLSNFAAGVMLILFRPFRVGDFIEAAGTSGIVENIQIFSTVLRTGDNREITVPNGPIFSGTIVNVTARDTRRIDLVFGIGYGDDLRRAKELIGQVLAAEERILADPAPAISIAELADSSVNLNVRPWVKSADYWPVRSDLLENVKAAFDSNGISIPFPQRDVHLFQVEAGSS